MSDAAFYRKIAKLARGYKNEEHGRPDDEPPADAPASDIWNHGYGTGWNDCAEDFSNFLKDLADKAGGKK